MLIIITSTILLTLSFLSTGSWQNSLWGDNAPNIRYRNFVAKTRRNSQLFSVYITSISFVFTLLVWSSGWHSMWGIGAALSAMWGIGYLYLCYKKKISPLKGEISENKLKNFFLTEVVFSYFYVFTWVQLATLIWPALQGILYY